MTYGDADFDKLLSADDAALDRLLDAIEAGETTLSAPYDVALPAGVGCWYRQDPGEPWQAMAIELWEWTRALGCEGEFSRRTRA